MSREIFETDTGIVVVETIYTTPPSTYNYNFSLQFFWEDGTHFPEGAAIRVLIYGHILNYNFCEVKDGYTNSNLTMGAGQHRW